MKKELIQLTKEREYIIMFLGIVSFTIFNYYAKSIIDFYDTDFLWITLAIAFPIFIFNSKYLIKLIQSLGYIAFTRRVAACLLFGLFLNVCFINSFKVIRIYRSLKGVKQQLVISPITSLNSSRFGYETIEFMLFEKKEHLKVSARMVGKLQTEGIAKYCVYLNLRNYNDVSMIDSYSVDYCN